MLKAKKKGFTLIELMIVIAIIAIIAAIAIPGLLQSQRASNERSASASLKTLASAEADFRANDRDANKVNDFWTFNVKSLYTMVPESGAPVTAANTIRLIELSVASADSAAQGTDGNNSVSITSLAVVAAKAGFWYQSLRSDQSGTPETYLVDTLGTDSAGAAIGAVAYHTSKFGFLAYPDSMSSGRFAYMLNEGNSIIRRALTGSIRGAGTTPAVVASMAEFIDFPNETTQKNAWGKMD